MPNYAKLAETALKLIKSSGQPLVFSRKTASTYDPVTGAESGVTTETGTFQVAILPASKGTLEAFDFRLQDGMRLDQVRFLLVAAKDAPWQPKGLDSVPDLEGNSWNVMGCTPLNPAGTPLLFKVGLKLV